MNKEIKKGLVPVLRFPEFKDSGEWEKKALNQVCDINPTVKKLPDNFIYIDLESVESGVLLQKKLIQLESAPSRAQRLLKNGDVIFQMVRPYQKNNYFFYSTDNFNYVASTGYAQLRAYQSNSYLFQYLHTDIFVDRVLTKCTGSNYPAINGSALSAIKIEIPKLPEQTKIAACLSSLDDLITAQTQKIEALKTHKKGLMQQLFPQEGETVPKLRFPEFRDSGEWKKTTLGEIASFFKGKGLPKSAITTEGRYLCVHYGELFTEYAEVIKAIKSRTDFNNDCFLSIANDVLMPTSDVTPNGLAKASCINKNDVILGGDILVIRTNKILINGEFLSRQIRYFEKQVLRFVSGSTVFHLYASSIEKLSIFIPSIQEQTKIAACLSSLDDLINAHVKKCEGLKNHKKGLMQGLFPVAGEK